MKPLLNLPFLSHGHATLTNLDESARFYREFLGFEVVKTSPKTLVARLGSNTVVIGVTLGERVLAKLERKWLHNAHFGLDVASKECVIRARELCVENRNKYKIRAVGELQDYGEQLCFLVEDLDGNFWEILNNLPDGYSTKFPKTSECDLSYSLLSFQEPPIASQDPRTDASILPTGLMSHLTVEVIDINKSRGFYERLFGLEMVKLGPKRLLARLNSVAVLDIIETDTEVREHKTHNHIGFDVAGPAEVDSAREIIVTHQDDLGIRQIRKISSSHGTYGFTFMDLDFNVWQIEDYPRGGYYWMFEQGGDLKNPFQPNVSGVQDWHELVDPNTYEYDAELA